MKEENIKRDEEYDMPDSLSVRLKEEKKKHCQRCGESFWCKCDEDDERDNIK